MDKEIKQTIEDKIKLIDILILGEVSLKNGNCERIYELTLEKEKLLQKKHP